MNSREGRGGGQSPPGDREPLLPKHGGYRNLITFQLARLIYDVTARFCDRHIDRRSRTHDQMVQAARSGMSNIAEGSVDSGTSKRTELKLTNIARGSLEELEQDYRHFLRRRGLPLWSDEDPRRKMLVARRCATADELAEWVRETARAEWREARRVRPSQDAAPDEKNGHDGQNGRDGQNGPDGPDGPDGQSCGTPQSIPSMSSISSMPSIQSIQASVAANALLVLIGVTLTLLRRQIDAQARSFESEGGITERMHRVRRNRRDGP